MSDFPSTILPGGLIAILGGGQLGRMTAMAARTMGYRVRVMDPEPSCPASFVVDETIVGPWDDVSAAQRLASGADVVTLEIEQIGVDALEAVASIAPLRPGVEPIRIIQDKTLQKTWLAEQGFPVGQFHVARNEDELLRAVRLLEGRVFLKVGRGGYDGRGQVRIGMEAPASETQIADAWRSLGTRAAVAERALELDCEISVMRFAILLAKYEATLRRETITRIRSSHGAYCPQAFHRNLKRTRRNWLRPSLTAWDLWDCCAWRYLLRSKVSYW